MSVIGSNIIAGASGTVETGYQISRSLRFNAPDGAYLTRTLGTPTSANTWTVSFWLKRANITFSQYEYIWSYDSSARGIAIDYSGGTNPDCLYVYNGTTSSYGTLQRLRDPGAWDHFVVSCNAGTVSVYRGGSSTAYITATGMPSMASGMVMQIGRLSSSGLLPLNAYLADFRFIDGQALTPSSFGETDSATGVWVPKAYTGTYGTNGFWLKFDDNSGVTATTLGKDSSGNSNNWTPNNFSVTAGAGNDSLVDSPTNYGTDTGAGGEVRGNYATLNPLSYNGTTPVLSNGNLDFKASSAAYSLCVATMGIPSSGKWYWEVAVTTITTAGNNQDIGAGKYPIAGTNNMTLTCRMGVTYSTLKYFYETPSVSPADNNAGLATPAQGDIMQIAYDAATGKLWMGVNNTWISSGNPATGANPLYTYSDPTGVFPFQVMYNTTGVSSTNFGQRPFAYTAPSGFKALCTTNLPTPAIGASASTLANKNFDISLWTGNGTSQNIVNSGAFQPDLLWIKVRSQAYAANIIDSIRGSHKVIIPSLTNAEATSSNANGVTAFNSDGFSLGLETDTTGSTNGSGYTFVGWQWKANGAGSSNTAGTITSTVSANTTAGISVVTWTNPASGSWTVGHGLGVAPKMIITKGRSGTNAWVTYHEALGNTKAVLLNTTAAADTNSAYWNNTSPTSSVFSMGSAGVIGASYTMVAYCFAEVAGFSKFGSYTGNGSADGTFVYCGFRPRYIMIKRTDSSTNGDWNIRDTARDPYNVTNKVIFANVADSEYSGITPYDILSNGFKLRDTGANVNASGGTYIFAAFGEAPFNYSRAR